MGRCPAIGSRPVRLSPAFPCILKNAVFAHFFCMNANCVTMLLWKQANNKPTPAVDSRAPYGMPRRTIASRSVVAFERLDVALRIAERLQALPRVALADVRLKRALEAEPIVRASRIGQQAGVEAVVPEIVRARGREAFDAAQGEGVPSRNRPTIMAPARARSVPSRRSAFASRSSAARNPFTSCSSFRKT